MKRDAMEKIDAHVTPALAHAPSSTTHPAPAPPPAPAPSPPPTLSIALADGSPHIPRRLADFAVASLRASDTHALAALVHPRWGVRFTPHGNVHPDDVVLTAAQLDGAMTDPTVREWGWYDGVAERIREPFAGYFAGWVYDREYARIPVEIDTETATSQFVTTAYPGSSAAEWFDRGREGWNDWRALRLVFVRDAKRWWLVGVVHGEWLI